MPALLTLGVGALAGAGIGAVQLLATWHEVRQSTRPLDDPNFATAFSLPPVQLLQLIEPYLFWGRIFRWNEAPGAGDEFAVYAGAVTLALSVWWLAARRVRTTADPRSLSRLAWWGLLMALVGLWLATGSHGGLYYIETWVPVVRGFRAPVRYVLFAQLGLTLVSVVALTQLMAAHGDAREDARRALWAPWALVVVSAGVALWLTRSGRVPAMTSAWVAAAGPGLFALAALLLSLVVCGSRPALAALVLLAAADNALYGIGGVIAWQDFLMRDQAESLADSRIAAIPVDDGRLVHGGLPNLHALAGYQLLDGYVGFYPRKMLDYHSLSALRVAGVHYAHRDFLGDAAIPGVVPLAHGWYQVPVPLPRARLVTETRVGVNPAREIDQIDVARIALTTHPVELSNQPPGTASIVRDDPGEIDVRAVTPGRQMLVVSESFNDAWAVSVDDRAERVERVDGDFLGVVVPAGTHTVRFRFVPPYYRAGRAISLGSLMLALALLASGGFRSRERRA